MPSAKTGVCSSCGKAVWKSKTSRDAIVCRDCRRLSPTPYGPRSSKAPFPTRICEWCGVEFLDKTRRIKRPQRFCSIAHATDANAHATGKVIRKGRVCEWCGKVYTASYAEQRTCSRECGAVLRNGAVWEWRTLVSFPLCQGCGVVMPPRTQGAYCGRACYHKSTKVYVVKQCVDCGVSTGGARSRCDACRDERARQLKRDYNRRTGYRTKHRKRARHYGVEYEPLSARDVFERDGWVCGVCGDPVDPTLKLPDLMCASLDHIVPMSKGGGHVWDNVQLAHFLCNSYKGDDESFELRIA